MAATKQFQGVAQTGLTLYFVAWNSLGEFCDHADGDFRDPAANPLLPATEKLATGVYFRDENRMTWIDDTVNYILVNAAGVVYATGGQITTRGDLVVDELFIFRYLRDIVAQLGRILAKLMGV